MISTNAQRSDVTGSKYMPNRYLEQKKDSKDRKEPKEVPDGTSS
jgi:hypothetical protein